MKNVSARVCAFACLATLTLAPPASAELIYGVAAVGNATALVTWDSASPSDLVSSQFVTGLQPNETILGIDYRLGNPPGQLFALGSSSRLYKLSVASGAVTQAPAPGGPFFPPLSGQSFGFGFIPNNGISRVVSETNSNLRITQSASVSVDVDVAYVAGDPNVGVDPNIVHVAYSPAGSTFGPTQFYGIDSGLNILATETEISFGELNTVGSLGIDVDAAGGFDVSGVTGIAYAALLPAGSSASQFYTIDLGTGAATLVGQIDGGLVITAMAVAPVIPEPATLGLLSVGMIGCLVARRRVG